MLSLTSDGDIVLRFLNTRFVAFGYLLCNPSGNILGCRVERQNIVEVTMIEHSVDFLFDMIEVAYHSVGVKLASFAENGHNPVVAMCVVALTRIGQVETMRPAISNRFDI